jgi:chromosome segregation protein
MKISRVKLAGFKSFVDPCELRIMPGLTGVVGPNGCGKSNLLEAIRWVMGEGSPKSLRGAAMDDVIFAGTASRPQRQFAEVSILAERADDEVEVVRRIERGAGSAYRINGRDARARDAQLIFADAATGAHSPALVSQGRIGAIIAAKPAERRAMLEEAAGISGLHVRRREAEIRLKATEANLARVEEVVADQEARIAVLRRQARSAERYRKLSDDIRTAEGRLIYARWRDAAAAAEEARTEAKAADEAVFAASEAQRTAAALSNEATGALATARAAAQSARDEAADARHRLATVEAERARIEARIADIAAQSDQLTADHAREGELARDAGEALTRLAAEADDLDVRLKAALAERPALVEAVGKAEEQSRSAEVALAQALAESAREAAERRVAEAALGAAKLRLDRAASAQERAKAELSALGDVATIAAARDAAVQARGAAQGDAETTLAAIGIAELARTAAAEARAKAEADAATTAASLASLESEAAALTRDLGNATGALSQVRAAPGYETALAAALADDLNAEIGDAGPRRWAGALIGASDPKLPVGDPLSAHVTAPKELARRLSQIAVVDVDDGSALAVGQRLVTRDGKLRRWDGFASDGAGAAAAEGLKRRNRLSDIETRLPEIRAVAEAASQAKNASGAALTEAGQQLDAARRARDVADGALRTALRAEDQAGLALERATAQAAEYSDRLARADAEFATAQAEHGDALAALAVLPATQDDVATRALDRAAHEAREAVAQLRADLAARDGRVTADKARHAAALSESADWRTRSGKAGKRVEDMAKRAAALEEESASLAGAPDRINAQAAMIGIEAARLADAAQHAVEVERAAEAAMREREETAAKVGEALSSAREVRAGAQARTENQDLRRVEMGRVAGERFECPAAVLPEKLGFDEATVDAASDESARLERATMERERLGPVNLVAESELAEIEAGRESNAADIAELTEAVHRLRGSIGSLNREGRTRLRAAFEAVDGHFRTLFGTLFNGGEAHLALIDSDDPLEAGLEIMAQPPGKKLSSLTLLSGGEQALTAVALIFALFLTNPAPLCVLDEVDAPLDDANVERFCDLLDAMTRDTDTRYLIVTHNAVTMARMHRLYGVTMIEQGISRLVSVDLGGAEALLAAE